MRRHLQRLTEKAWFVIVLSNIYQVTADADTLQHWMAEPRASTLMQGTDYRSDYSREYRDEHELGGH